MTEPAAKPCPVCGEPIAAAASQCPHCGERLVNARRRVEPTGEVRLKVAAALQGLIGLMAAMMVPCVGLGLVMQSTLPAAQRQKPGAAIGGLVIYAAIAAFLLVTAMGAWRHRRWARPIMLSLCVPALGMGLLAVVALAIVHPVMVEMITGFAGASGGPAPPGVFQVVMVVVAVVAAAIYVGIPGTLVALYWSPRLREACERIDESPRWTDGVPLPVLGTSLWLGLFAAGGLAIPAYGVAPAFGALLTGWAALGYAVVLAAALAGAAVAVLRRHPAGWFAALAVVSLLGASHVVTFVRVPFIDLYRAMGTPPEQLRVLESLDLTPMTTAALLVGGVALVAALVFLVYLRRFFIARPRLADSQLATHPHGAG